MNAPQPNFSYQGNELELFAQAKIWHRYLRRMIAGYIGGQVLEVGAGHGTLTGVLCQGAGIKRWLCLDPDARHVALIDRAITEGKLPAVCRAHHGYASGLASTERFDTILYLDVLEHIENDREEMAIAARHLLPGGHLIVLSPAFETLRSARDEVLGHFRRYNKEGLRAVMPDSLKEVTCGYVDSMGAVAVLANRLLLRQEEAHARQLRIWDLLLVPLSRGFDPLLRHILGRSVLWIGQPRGGA